MDVKVGIIIGNNIINVINDSFNNNWILILACLFIWFGSTDFDDRYLLTFTDWLYLF